MRIKPWLITATAAAASTAALAVIMVLTAPTDAGARFLVLFWASLAIALWSGSATLWLWMRASLSSAVWGGLAWGAGALAALLVWREGVRSGRLLGGIVFVTLFVSFVVWRRFRHGRT